MTWDIKAGVMGKGLHVRLLHRMLDHKAERSVQREAAEYILSHFPDIHDKISVDEYLHERNHMQEELFRKVPPMTGAVALVRGLVSQGKCFTGGSFGERTRDDLGRRRDLMLVRSTTQEFRSPLRQARTWSTSSLRRYAHALRHD
jgi:hypothetical protein